MSSSILFMSFLITERDIYYELCIMLTLFLKLNHFFASTLEECDKKSSAERTPCPKKLIIAESSNSVHFFSKVLHIASAFFFLAAAWIGRDRSGCLESSCHCVLQHMQNSTNITLSGYWLLLLIQFLDILCYVKRTNLR